MFGAFAERLPEVRVAGVHDEGEHDAEAGVEHRRQDEVQQGAQGDAAVHLRVQARRAGDEGRYDQGQDDQLQQPHEQFARVGYQEDHVFGQLERSQSEAWNSEQNRWDTPALPARGRWNAVAPGRLSWLPTVSG